MGIFTATDPDRERYEQLREIVRLGIAQFRKVGSALREIRDHELYKFDCTSFEQCCKLHWEISVAHAYRLIDLAQFADEVSPTGETSFTERQVRPIMRLPKQQRAEAWHEAAAEGATPEAITKAVSKRRRGRPRKPKAIRLRVPGAWVVIQPNHKFSGPEQTLQWAIEQLAKRAAA